jgi:16S rRNA (cytidine1402-2'-O)-methyltransferase
MQENLDSPRGTLYLVPGTLDFACSEQVPVTDVLPQRTLEVASGLHFWVCENAKSLRAYLKRVAQVSALALPIQQIDIKELPHLVHKKGDHQGASRAVHSSNIQALLAPLLQGHDLGLASEAGIPAVADPGSSVVRAAHEMGVRVVPLVGPSSLIMALSAMGLNGQSFAFVGYVPHEGTAQQKRLKELESVALRSEQTQLIIETPYRNNALFKAMLACLQPNTRVGISTGLTLGSASTACKTVAAWRKEGMSLAQDIPVVFALGT